MAIKKPWPRLWKTIPITTLKLPAQQVQE